MAIRVVNVGRAPAMRVTGEITRMLSRDGLTFEEHGREQHARGALPPTEEIEVRVWVDGEARKAAKSSRGAFRADIRLDYQSVSGARHKLLMTARYDGKHMSVRDVED